MYASEALVDTGQQDEQVNRKRQEVIQSRILVSQSVQSLRPLLTFTKKKLSQSDQSPLSMLRLGHAKVVIPARYGGLPPNAVITLPQLSGGGGALNIIYLTAVLTTKGSEQYAPDPTEYPYLALIEVKQEKNVSNYYNGVFASLSWVMTVSASLAQEQTGRPRNNSFLVYGGLDSFNGTRTAQARKVKKIVTDLMGSEDNKYFPNLVLLRLESSFLKSRTLRPAVFNVGKLSLRSLMVGWAVDHYTGLPLSRPVVFPVKSLSSTQCSHYALVEFKEQFCAVRYMSSEKNFRLWEGALLVDKKNYVTGLMQFTTYLSKKDVDRAFMVVVRLSYFQTFWEFYVIDANKTFLETKFKDDITFDPWITPGGEKTTVISQQPDLFPRQQTVCYINNVSL
ncbi:uncharacterized protein LOC128989419 [Macrosteles quadrilineatus]|uniref:uncharacterized protein LOC128989419 n=1 Tax=Macrosteles quadrilineatus TaxID=74068 RepID=UPI0023E255DB|nr:uncharacterized protein LOC128989419 [Macrosteles quadrilineatus]